MLSVAMDQVFAPSASAIDAAREKHAFHHCDDFVEMKNQQPSVDSLDEIRRVTDANCIAKTELQECFPWEPAAMCVDKDDRASSATQDFAKLRTFTAYSDRLSEDDSFEITTESEYHFFAHGTFEALNEDSYDQGGKSYDGETCSSIYTKFDKRKYRAWVGAMNLHIL